MNTRLSRLAGILQVPRGQIANATRAVWAVVTLVFALVLLSSAVLPVEVAAGLSARCQLRERVSGSATRSITRRCPLCGMTRAFLAISRGRFSEAQASNAGGITLYVTILGDQVAFAVVALCRRRRRACGGTKRPPLA